MQVGNASGGPDGAAVEKQKQDAAELTRRYQSEIRPFLEKHAGEGLASLDNDVDRIERLLRLPYTVTACFLGHSGIGKSTLLNALAAGREHILPSGGIGPLTALATEVRYSLNPQFSVRYHKRAKPWKLVFGLERSHQTSGDDSRASAVPAGELNEELKSDVQVELDADAEAAKTESRASSLVKQAQQIVTGDQFKARNVPYLIDALRTACGYKAQWATEFAQEDADRIQRVQTAPSWPRPGNPTNERRKMESRFKPSFGITLPAFWLPLSTSRSWLAFGPPQGGRDSCGPARCWNRARFLSSNHSEFIRDNARAVILTVDRAGPTGETIELLRSSGYWDRLVGAHAEDTRTPMRVAARLDRAAIDAVAGML